MINQESIERIHIDECQLNIPSYYEQNYGYINPLISSSFSFFNI